MQLVSDTPVQEFYRDSVVFVTGATGFLGSAVLEKLLRSCQTVRKIYILVREKKGKTPEKRIEEIFDGVFFDEMKKENPNYKDCISVIIGDIAEDNLGISPTVWEMLTKEVNIVIHIAATVRFTEKIKLATKINLLGTKTVLDLSKQCQHIKSVVHVSTAYANSIRYEIEETFYSPPCDPAELIEFTRTRSDEELEELEPKLLGEFLNTYTFTKCLSEDLVRKEANNLPICIVRPSIVMGPLAEPIPGYVNTLNGPYGMMAGVGMGLIRVMDVDEHLRLDIVPLDFTANSILVAAQAQRSMEKCMIYNLVSCNQNPLTWGEFAKWTMYYAPAYVCNKAYWCYCFLLIKNRLAFYIAKFFLHTLPGFFLDFGLKITGKKTFAMKIYEKLDKGTALLVHYRYHEWILHDENTQALFHSLDERDKKMFNFNIKEIHWDLFLLHTIRSIRIHLLNDPMSTHAEARKRYLRFKRITFAMAAVAVIILYNLFMIVFNKIFY